MAALNLFKRDTSKPRITIRERFRNAAARMMPRSRGSRAGGVDTSRRALMAGAAASAAVLPLPAVATPGDDSELFALFEEWTGVQAHFSQACNAENEAEALWHTLRPEFPEACIRQERDAEFGLCLPARVGERYEAELINQRRGKVWKRSVYTPVTDEVRAKRNLPPDADKIHSREPWPEAQARLEEIIAAWDKHREDIAAAHEESGYADATEERVEAVRALLDIESRIARTRAKTLQGMVLKARMVAEDDAFTDAEEQLETALRERFSTGGFIGISLVLDIMQMKGGNT